MQRQRNGKEDELTDNAETGLRLHLVAWCIGLVGMHFVAQGLLQVGASRQLLAMTVLQGTEGSASQKMPRQDFFLTGHLILDSGIPGILWRQVRVVDHLCSRKRKQQMLFLQRLI